MPTLHIIIGISGSGKSTYAKNILFPSLENAEIVSTDNIREELFGNASVQKEGGKVFNLAYQRAREALKNKKDVIFDATNLSRKSRKALISQMPQDNLKIQCHLVLATPEQAMQNQKQRQRQVPENVVYRQFKSFTMPSKEEGITEPTVFYNAFYDERLLENLSKKMYEVDQTSKWHIENAGTHTDMVLANIRKMSSDRHLDEAAKYHDIGKIYTRSVDDNGETHFYGHANVSAYLYLCGKVNELNIDEKTLYTLELISHHDDSLNKNFDINSFRKEYGEKMAKDLIILRTSDIKGAIRREQFDKMSALEFLNTFPDWREIIQKDPLNIMVKEDGNYILLKYNQFNTDMDYRIARESRGSVFKNNNNRYSYACRPFDKFFNYGEEHASEINWNTARVTEKVDGSLMKLWYDDNKWHLSTNGTIDAFKASVTDSQITFGEIYERALGTDIQSLGKNLDKKFTYLFELTSPETQVVIPYEDGVWYLSKIETITGNESFELNESEKAFFAKQNVQYPKTYVLTSLDETVEAAKLMSKDEEGFVINDDKGHRIKVKSPEYLVAAHLRENGYVSDKKILNYIKEEKIDDLLAYAPQYKERVDNIKEKIKDTIKVMEKEWKEYSPYLDNGMKEYAMHAKNSFVSDFLFKKARNPELKETDYLLSQTTNNTEIIINKAMEMLDFDRLAEDKTASLDDILRAGDKLNNSVGKEEEKEI